MPAQAPGTCGTAITSMVWKLYVQRVFIMDDAEQFMPNYLRLCAARSDSNDLPAERVARDPARQPRDAKSRGAPTKRVLQMLISWPKMTPKATRNSGSSLVWC
ncbi:hypothetical protein M8494_20390 [Serratia ureilytica]